MAYLKQISPKVVEDTMVFETTLQQMIFLFALILLGYLLMKFKCVPENSQTVLSKLENWLFIPALILSTFITSFTIEKLSSTSYLLLFSIVIEVLVIPLALLCVRLLSKDNYIRNIYMYGLCFSNFGFMGNAIVAAIFPEIFLEYIIFTLVLWTFIYLWGTPSLLMSTESNDLKSRLENLLNPMFVCMILGIIFGLTSIKLPTFVTSMVSSVSGCMSPVAMLITGMTIAQIDIKSVLKIKSIYFVTVLRLVAFPLLFLGGYYLLNATVRFTLPESFLICMVASLSMPLGLNTIVIPSAYGKDTTVAAGMTLVSHVLSILTIPLIFMLL